MLIKSGLFISILQILQKILSFIESKLSFPIIEAIFVTKAIKSFDRLFSIYALSIGSLHNVSNFSFGSFVERFMRQKLSVFSIFNLYIFLFTGLASKIFSKHLVAILLSYVLHFNKCFVETYDLSILIHQFFHKKNTSYMGHYSSHF